MFSAQRSAVKVSNIGSQSLLYSQSRSSDDFAVALLSIAAMTAVYLGIDLIRTSLDFVGPCIRASRHDCLSLHVKTTSVRANIHNAPVTAAGSERNTLTSSLPGASSAMDPCSFARGGALGSYAHHEPTNTHPHTSSSPPISTNEPPWSSDRVHHWTENVHQLFAKVFRGDQLPDPSEERALGAHSSARVRSGAPTAVATAAVVAGPQVVKVRRHAASGTLALLKRFIVLLSNKLLSVRSS